MKIVHIKLLNKIQEREIRENRVWELSFCSGLTSFFFAIKSSRMRLHGHHEYFLYWKCWLVILVIVNIFPVYMMKLVLTPDGINRSLYYNLVSITSDDRVIWSLFRKASSKKFVFWVSQNPQCAYNFKSNKAYENLLRLLVQGIVSISVPTPIYQSLQLMVALCWERFNHHSWSTSSKSLQGPWTRIENMANDESPTILSFKYSHIFFHSNNR